MIQYLKLKPNNKKNKDLPTSFLVMNFNALWLHKL